MAKTPSSAEVAAAFRVIADWFDAGGSLPQGGNTTSTDAADVELLDEDETRNMAIKELRALAVELGLDEQKVKSGILAELENKGFFGEAADEDDEDAEDEDQDGEEEEDDDEDGDEEEEEGYTREDLEEMDLKTLRAIAKSEGHNATEYRTADQDALVDLILGEEAEEEEEQELDEEALKAMDLAELKAIAKELSLKVPLPVAKNKTKLIDFILENAAEDDE